MLADVTFSSDFLLETSPATFGDVYTIGEGKGIEEAPQCLLAHLLRFLLGSSRQFSSRKSTEKPFFQLTLLKGRMDEKAPCCNFSVIPQVG